MNDYAHTYNFLSKMKKYIVITFFATLFAGCEPPRIYLTSFVKLKANINKTNEVISLGDTLKIRLVLPDTLYTEQNERIPVNSLEESWYSADIFKIDTILKISNYLPKSDYFVSEGTIQGYGKSFFLNNSSKPFANTINIVPKEKGIYTISVHTQATNLRINGNNQPIGLITGFDAVDCHFMLLNPYYPEIVRDSARSKQEGFGYYNFRVN